jgi:hypothetical protein
METTVNDRLNLLVDTFENGKKARFARAIGLSAQGAQSMLTGRQSEPGYQVLVQILNAYPQVSMEWLIFGRGEMLKGQQPEGADQNHGAAVVAESETLLKLAVAEERLRATQEQLEEKKQENGWLREMLGKPLSSLDAAVTYLRSLGQPAGLELVGQR